MNIERDNNPYAAPSSLDDYGLPRHDRTTLEFYLRHRAQPLTLGFMLSRCVPIWFVLAAVFAAVAFAVSLLHSGSYTILAVAFVAGAMIGTVSRDIGYCFRIARRWRLLVNVLDWDKIERLRQENR
jgi:hypothetical protein